MYWTHSELQKRGSHAKTVEEMQSSFLLDLLIGLLRVAKGLGTSRIVRRADIWNFIMKVTMHPVYNSNSVVSGIT